MNEKQRIKYLKARVKILERLFLEEAIKCQILNEELAKQKK